MTYAVLSVTQFEPIGEILGADLRARSVASRRGSEADYVMHHIPVRSGTRSEPRVNQSERLIPHESEPRFKSAAALELAFENRRTKPGIIDNKPYSRSDGSSIHSVLRLKSKKKRVLEPNAANCIRTPAPRLSYSEQEREVQLFDGTTPTASQAFFSDDSSEPKPSGPQAAMVSWANLAKSGFEPDVARAAYQILPAFSQA